MNAYFLNALLRVRENVLLDYSATVATWKEHHPQFDVKIKYAGGTARIIGTTKSEDLDSNVWHWLDKGTTKRWAVMTNPFSPKTRRRVIGSVAGVGQMAFVISKKRRYKRPPWRPGITAREWTQAIKRNNYYYLRQQLNDAVNKSLVSGKGPYRDTKRNRALRKALR